MNWLNKLERRFGGFGIPNLMMYITSTTLIFTLVEMFGGVPVRLWLSFSREMILRGQVWRLITFLFVDYSGSLFTLVLMLYFYYWIGCRLEYAWGVFQFTLYYLLGTIGAILGGFITGVSSATYLNLSLFLAYAALFPNEEILFMMFIPLKVKYLAMLDWVIFGAAILFQPLGGKLAALLALANFFIFFWPYISGSVQNYFKYRKVRNNFRNQMRKNNVVKGPWDDRR
ncbi:MAG: rhomboid family intramembrane serine protease [Angelakisella sp.]|nr:rhomboid family intramembrane serine protease [Angelakisella sp.]MCI9528151.1 rhomboid family intramembrane serine protease [Angelakisella sp.]